MTFICYGDLCCLEHLQYKYRDSACHSIQIQKSSLAAIFHLQNGTNIPFSPLVRSLGLTLDPTLIFRQNISNICETAYFGLGRISSVRHYLSVDATKTLVSSFVLSRLDYCRSLLAGFPKFLLKKLQRIQNNATRVILRSSKLDHVSSLLHARQWLLVYQPINFKLSSNCFPSVTSTGPQ